MWGPLSVLESLLSAVGSFRQTWDVSIGFRALKSRNAEASACGELSPVAITWMRATQPTLEYANTTIHPAEGIPRRIEARH